MRGRLDRQDLLILLGVLLIGVGAWMAWRPAGLMVTGALLLGLALWRM